MDGLVLFGGKRKRQQDNSTKSVDNTLGSHDDSADGVMKRVEHHVRNDRNCDFSEEENGSPGASYISTDDQPESFSEYGLSSIIVNAAKSMGVKVPTPIQRNSIGRILSGPDLIGCAQTGTGKTAAFALPILQKLSEDPYGVFGVILTPSRELAFQITDQVKAFGLPMGVRVSTICGGLDMVEQGIELSKRPHLIIATPGRLAYHILQGGSKIDLSRVAFLILDECDRLIEDSFRPDLTVILNALNEVPLRGKKVIRQTLLFSATLNKELTKSSTLKFLGIRLHNVVIADAFGSEFAVAKKSEDEDIVLSAKALDNKDVAVSRLLSLVTADNLKQEYLFVPASVKNAYLWQLLLALGPTDLTIGDSSSSHSDVPAAKKKKSVQSVVSGSDATNIETDDTRRAKSIIIFVSSCYSAQLISELCIELGIPSAPLHSAMRQQQRLASLTKFKGGNVRVLVATDVASRGLDIQSVDLVINYDVPRVPTDYVHRVGRTARAGRGGRAVTIVTQYEVDILKTIEDKILKGKQLEKVPDNVCPENVVLQKLTKIASALYLARSRMSETGLEERLRIKKERKYRNTDSK